MTGRQAVLMEGLDDGDSTVASGPSRTADGTWGAAGTAPARPTKACLVSPARNPRRDSLVCGTEHERGSGREPRMLEVGDDAEADPAEREPPPMIRIDDWLPRSRGVTEVRAGLIEPEP